MKKSRFKTALAVSLVSLSVASTEQAQTTANRQPNRGKTKGRPASKVQSQKDQLKIKERRVKGIVILDLEGRFKTGESNIVLRRAISNLLMKRERNIVVNLAGVTSIDEIGIKGLVSNFQLVNRVNGQLKLLKPSEKIKKSLLAAFNVYDMESEAINSFSPPIKANTRATTTPRKTCESKEELEKRVRQIIIDELGVDEQEVIPNALFVNDLGADSLDEVELIMRFEEEFTIEIPDEDAKKLKRVGDVFEYLWRRVCALPK